MWTVFWNFLTPSLFVDHFTLWELWSSVDFFEPLPLTGPHGLWMPPKVRSCIDLIVFLKQIFAHKSFNVRLHFSLYTFKVQYKLDVTGVTDTTSIILEYGSCFCSTEMFLIQSTYKSLEKHCHSLTRYWSDIFHAMIRENWRW